MPWYSRMPVSRGHESRSLFVLLASSLVPVLAAPDNAGTALMARL